MTDHSHDASTAGRRQTWIAAVVVFAVAVVARVLPMLTASGYHGYYGYDSGVYYASADALVHGRLAYRDFLLLHPPLLMIVLAPFAVLARLVGDRTAFLVSAIAFAALGGVNAVLVIRVARRIGLGVVAAVAGGAFYALWFGSVQAEFSPRLEPLGNTFVLLALLAGLRARASTARRWPLLFGAALGAACSVKIWWAVPLVVLLAWHLLGERRRPGDRTRFLWAPLGAVVAMVAVNGVFFAAAPRAMWRDLVVAQLGRTRDTPSNVKRLLDLIEVHRLADGTVPPALGVVVGVVLVWAAVTSLRTAFGRWMLALSLLDLLAILSAPHWAGYYADYLAPSLALMVATSVSVTSFVLPSVTPRVRVRLASAVVVGTLAVLAFQTFDSRPIHPFNIGRMRSAVAGQKCVTSDSPLALIELNVLTRDFDNGCRQWVDVSGRSYGPDAERRPDGRAVARKKNKLWQRDLVKYLRSGNAVILVRPETGISTASQRTITKDGVLACSGGYCIYRVARS